MSWLVAGAAIIGGGIKLGGILSGNKKKAAARKAAKELKKQQLIIAGEERDLALEAGQQASTSGQLDVGLQATAATKNIFAQSSQQTAKAGMATQGTVQNIQTSAVGGVTAKAQSDVQKLVATRVLGAEQTELGYEKAELGYEKTKMGIEQQYQGMLSANQKTGFWEGAGQVVGAGMQGVQTGVAISDRELKKNIKKVGKSPSGIPIYTFKFKNPDKYGHGKYKGTMSDKVPKRAKFEEGKYDMVNYSKIDIDFEKIGV